MCNVMMSYFKRNQKLQRNKRKRRYEQVDPSISEQAYQSMSGAIRVEHIIDGEIRLQQIDLRGIIILEQIGVKASGEKRDRSEQSDNITEREKSRAKREKKSVVRRSQRRVRKVVWSREEQSVQYITMHRKQKIRLEKADKQWIRNTQNDGR